MVLELCGGEPSEITVAGKAEVPERVIDFPLDELPRLAGLDVGLPEVERVLGRLGFSVAERRQEAQDRRAVVAGRRARARPMSSRRSCASSASTACRPTPFDRGDAPRKPVLTPIQLRTRKAKRALAARGMVEAVTWSFIAKPQAELFGGGKPELALANPIAADLSDMRPSLMPGLIAAAQKNADRGLPTSRCSRSDRSSAAIGRRTSSPRPPACAARLPSANGIGRHWSAPPTEVDAFDVKADALAVLAAAGAPAQALQVVPGGPAWFHPGRSRHDPDRPAERARPFRRAASARARGARRRRPAGRVRGDPGKDPGAEGEGDASEAGAGALPVPAGRARLRLRGRPRGQGGDILRATQSVDRKLITNVTVFDVYEGQGIEPGKKSIAIAVTLQPRDKTMTDEEIEAVAARIVAEVGKRTGGTLRS